MIERFGGTAVALGLCCLVLAGCTYRIVSSEKVGDRPADVPANAERGGLVYSLPMTLITVTAKKEGDSVTYQVAPTILPDPNARYRLRYAPTGVTDDDISFQVDRNGLLTSARATETDRTGDIIIALAKAATAAATMARTSEATPATPEDGQYPFTRIYDYATFVNGVNLPGQARIEVDRKYLPKSTSRPDCSYSVCYRVAVPVVATLRSFTVDQKGTRTPFESQFAFMAVDPDSLEGIDLNTAAMVTRTNSITFDSGLITSIAINQPSTSLAIANLPLNVLSAVLSVPANLLTLRVANVQGEANLVQAQANLLNQMKLLMDAQAAAQAPSAPAPQNAPMTGLGSRSQ
jgi:hypothetical protein